MANIIQNARHFLNKANLVADINHIDRGNRKFIDEFNGIEWQSTENEAVELNIKVAKLSKHQKSLLWYFMEKMHKKNVLVKVMFEPSNDYFYF